jgi:hypothetical protein
MGVKLGVSPWTCQHIESLNDKGLRRISRIKTGWAPDVPWKLRNEELHNLHSSSNICKSIKRIKHVRETCNTHEERFTQNFGCKTYKSRSLHNCGSHVQSNNLVPPHNICAHCSSWFQTWSYSLLSLYAWCTWFSSRLGSHIQSLILLPPHNIWAHLQLVWGLKLLSDLC